MSMTLVACFSPTGNTLKVAEMVHGLVKSTLFVIKPENPYTAADLDWNDPKSRSSLEMNDPASRPAIADRVEDMAAYRTVFLGFPVWWYEAPRIILTFLDGYDFTGKVCIPFVTSGGSGLGKIPQLLEKACPVAHWLPGRRFPPNPPRLAVEEWMRTEHGWQ